MNISDLRQRLDARTYPTTPRRPEERDVTRLDPDARAAYMQDLNEYDRQNDTYRAEVAAYTAVEADVTRELYARLREAYPTLTEGQHKRLCEYAHRERHSESDWPEQTALLYSEIADIFS